MINYNRILVVKSVDKVHSVNIYELNELQSMYKISIHKYILKVPVLGMRFYKILL